MTEKIGGKEILDRKRSREKSFPLLGSWKKTDGKGKSAENKRGPRQKSFSRRKLKENCFFVKSIHIYI